MSNVRIGMLVPSLNTIAEDDFRAFCPPGAAYHVHRVRLRNKPGRVTVEDLGRAYDRAIEDAGYLADLAPAAIAFNCTGASVARGPSCDLQLAERMTAALGVPCTNTMVGVKQALSALKADDLLHVCPFTGDSARIEREALLDAGFRVRRTVALNFADARMAAQMTPEEVVAPVLGELDDSIGAVLLSCANVRAFEAAAGLERVIDRPVVTSNQAMLWSVLKAAGWTGTLPAAGRLFGQ